MQEIPKNEPEETTLEHVEELAITYEPVQFCLYSYNLTLELNADSDKTRIIPIKNIERDIRKLKRQEWVLIAARIDTPEDFMHVESINKKLHAKRIFCCNFLTGNLELAKIKPTKKSSYILFDHSQNSQQIAQAIQDIRNVLTHSGFVCADLFDLEYLFKNKILRYYSKTYTSNEDLIQLNQQFVAEKKAEDIKETCAVIGMTEDITIDAVSHVMQEIMEYIAHDDSTMLDYSRTPEPRISYFYVPGKNRVI